MRLTVVLMALLGCLTLAITRTDAVRSSGWADELSKTQPKEMVLLKDSQSDKFGEVPFNHETHSTMKYSPDGTAVIACIECHHTDAPASALKAPYKTSERDVVLTTPVLEKPDQKGVKKCRACHLQKGDDSAAMPEVTYAGDSDPTKLTNEVGNHKNCNVCHDNAVKARPALKDKKDKDGKVLMPGSNDCLVCHKPV